MTTDEQIKTLEEKQAALESRIAFLEGWMQLPAQYLPGYVAPVPEPAEVVAEPVAGEPVPQAGV